MQVRMKAEGCRRSAEAERMKGVGGRGYGVGIGGKMLRVRRGGFTAFRSPLAIGGDDAPVVASSVQNDI